MSSAEVHLSKPILINKITKTVEFLSRYTESPWKYFLAATPPINPAKKTTTRIKNSEQITQQHNFVHLQTNSCT